MPTSSSGRLRRLWLDAHLWIGVGLLAVIIPLSLSGAVLVWHDALALLSVTGLVMWLRRRARRRAMTRRMSQA